MFNESNLVVVSTACMDQLGVGSVNAHLTGARQKITQTENNKNLYLILILYLSGQNEKGRQ